MRTAEDVRVGYAPRALAKTAADIDGMVTSHSETLTEQNGAAVLYLTVHAEEQIGTEAVDDSTVPEKMRRWNRCRRDRKGDAYEP